MTENSITATTTTTAVLAEPLLVTTRDHRGPVPAYSLLEAGTAATRTMIDSAWPVKQDKTIKADILLVYVGGDTPHPWTNADITAQPERYIWPTWVRSNPTSALEAGVEAALFVAWLHGHNVPPGVHVILDLETAVNAAYVNTFNLAMRAAGYKCTKYGSQNYIWKNPKTDGGTFVALPGPAVLTTEGDTVARQYAFDGSYDLSVVQPQSQLKLWDVHPPAPVVTPTPPAPAPAPAPAPVDNPDWGDTVDAELQLATAKIIAARRTLLNHIK